MNRRKFLNQSIIAGTALATLPVACSCKMDTEFLILGGGLSGLYMAYLLQKAGKEYMILEGSDRIGGRMYFHPEIKQDVGGRGIGDKYTEVMSLVEELNVPLVDITQFTSSPKSYYIDGDLREAWSDRKSDPSILQYTTDISPPQLNSLDEWYQRSDLDQAYADQLRARGRTDREVELINLSANYNDVNKTSAINDLHSSAFRKFNGSKSIYNFEGGTKTFITAVADALTGPIQTGKYITHITNKTDCAAVKCSDGTTYCAPQVISTMPFSTLRDVDCDIPFNQNQKQAINQLAYTTITQIHFTAQDAYWEEDGLSASMWTDTPLERIMTMGFEDDNRDLVCWVNGIGTSFIDNMSESELRDYTLKTLKKIRPSTEGKIDYTGAHSWGKYKYNKGAYAEFLVGQPALFLDMIRPAGNVYFAGEHTAMQSRGIEAAAESARQVLDLFKKENIVKS